MSALDLNSLAVLPNGSSTAGQVQLMVLLLGITLVIALVARGLRLPYTLVLVLVGLILGLLPVLTEVHLDPAVVLFLFLPALLFEGAWNVDMDHLLSDWLPVFLLAVPGLALSLVLVATALHWGMALPWLLAALLGAMVSPTDPVAVLALLRQLGMSARLRTIVEGESLFNDGVGAAAFTLVLAVLLPRLGGPSATPSWWTVAASALWLVFGGFGLGLGIGWLAARVLTVLDDYLVEITVTFSIAYGVYLVALALRTSGLLAVVGAGLVLGSYGRRKMSRRTRDSASAVWEFVSYVANSFLFLLLGIEIGSFGLAQALPGIGWALLGVGVGRILMTYTLLPLHDFIARRQSPSRRGRERHWPRPVERSWRPLLILSGLRGALSIALVLSLPAAMPNRSLLEGIVYGVVLVTLLGQGLGLRFLLPRWKGVPATV